ncbi:MAG: NUDIX domain-containing protein [Bacteroidetes bacterium]|nr:MAG: NUDIX domain-containing protein [Bacteroidota bacterium]
MPYCYDHPRPALTVDCVIFGLDASAQLKVLLIQRANEPFIGQWALPGGFVGIDEDIEAAALRELEEETGVRDLYIEQFHTFGRPDRDPRGRVVSVAHFALVNLEDHPVRPSSDARRVEWFEIEELPRLAFDHDEIIAIAIEKLRQKVRHEPLVFELLPAAFTLSQLQQIYEKVMGVTEGFNKRNFRSRMLKTGLLKEVGRQKGVAHRPAKLYSFDREAWERLHRKGALGALRKAVDFDI